MIKHFGSNQAVKWSQAGDVVEVSGVLIEAGTFIPSDGEAVTFDSNSIGRIHGNMKDNLPLWITHEKIGRNVPIGWVYKFARSGDQILWEGKVFNSDAIPIITSGGFDKTSMEADLEIVDGLVIDGVVKANAFVNNPAVKSAQVDVKPVAMSKGGKHMGEDPAVNTVEGNGASPVVNYNFGVAPTEPVDGGNKSTEEDPVIKEFQSKMADLEAANKTLVDENASLKDQIGEIRQAEFETLKTSLVDKGIAEPEKLVEGLSLDQQISTLKNFASLDISTPAAVAPAAPAAPVVGAGGQGAPVEDGGKEKLFEETLAKMGCTDMYKELYGGSN